MKSKDVLRLLKITRPTLCNYVKSGKIKVTKLKNGYYNYHDNTVYDLLNSDVRINVIYARVSTINQKKDLQKQINSIQTFCNNYDIEIENIYSDISSGLSLNRKNFNILLERVFNHEIKVIYISYKDRISRLSFKTLKNIFLKFGTDIVVINDSYDNKTIEKELLEELISLIHSYSMKMYSNRRKHKFQLLEKDLILENKIKIL